jgi:multiple antibiotic resistance protein
MMNSLYALVTLIVVIDPLSIVPFFVAVTRGLTEAELRRIALRAPAIALGVLVVFALLGEALLTALGISLAAFRIAGGALLFMLAIDMLFARQSGLRSVTLREDAEAMTRPDVTVFPLAIPLIAGPGALATVVLLMGRAPALWPDKAVVLGLVVLVLGLVCAALLLSRRLFRLLGVTGNNVISRVLGIVLAALAVQFVIDGVKAALAP